MGLSQLLDKQLQTKKIQDHTVPGWRQFILDHLDYITARTIPSEIDRLLIHQYRFDLSRFLRDRMSRQEDIAWIVLLLNNMSSDFDFKDPGTYIIPTDDLIIKLYHAYITIDSNQF